MLEYMQEFIGFGLPTLLFLVVGATVAGFNPVQAISANKLQGTLGALASTHYYLGKGIINLAILRSLGLGAMLGGALGTCLVYFIGNCFLEFLLPFMLVTMALYFSFSRQVGDQQQESVLSLVALACSVIPVIGFYDGSSVLGRALFT